jgi:hypothetical protein
MTKHEAEIRGDGRRIPKKWNRGKELQNLNVRQR